MKFDTLEQYFAYTIDCHEKKLATAQEYLDKLRDARELFHQGMKRCTMCKKPRPWAFMENKDKATAAASLDPKTGTCKGCSNTKQQHKKMGRPLPSWLGEEEFAEISDLYEKAWRLTQSTGEPHEVHHKIPKNHPDVWGLHVPSNLEVLSRTDHMREHLHLS